MSASFQTAEPGLEHQMEMPHVPPPDSLPSEEDWRRRYADRLPAEHREQFLRKRPIELRPVGREDIFHPERGPPHQSIWMRATGALPAEVGLHQCVLAYASDMTLLDTALMPHGIGLVRPAPPDREHRPRDAGSIGRSGPMNGCFTRRTVQAPRARAVSPAALCSRPAARLLLQWRRRVLRLRTESPRGT